MRYQDFVVQVGLLPSGQLRARVLRSPAGEGESVAALPAWLGEPFFEAPAESEKRGRAKLERDVVRRIREKPVEGAIGAQLHEALFSGVVGRLWDQSWGSLSGHHDEGLRLRLQFDLEARDGLADLPWELLFRVDTGSYLALDRRTPVMRHLEVPQPVRPQPLPARLKVLGVAASPRELDQLDLTTEKGNLESRGKKARRWEVHVIPQPTVDQLRRKLIEKGSHVLHFMGHGDFDPQLQTGALQFEDDCGRVAPWSGQDFAATLAGISSLRLVVLNACQTATSGTAGDPYGGVASALVRGGVPAVIAMQKPISDAAAIAFSNELYLHLAAGARLEEALTEGRQAIHTLDPRSSEWGTPVLFARATSLDPDREARLPRIFHGAFGAVLLLLLLLVLVPGPSRADVVLRLSTSFVRFRLPAGDQRIFDRLILEELGATRLAEVKLAAEGPPNPVPPPLDLLLSVQDPARASITLQQSILPGNSWVSLRRQEDGNYNLAIEPENELEQGQGFVAVMNGPYRVLLRTAGKPPRRFEADAAIPELVGFTPRGRHASLDLKFRSYDGNEFHSPIEVDDLELFEVQETAVQEAAGREATELAAKFQLSGEVAVEGGAAVPLPPGSQLRLREARGVLQSIVPGEKGIEVVFAGSVAGISHGLKDDPRDMMPRRTSAMEIFTNLVGSLAGLITLVEFATLGRRMLKSAGIGRARK